MTNEEMLAQVTRMFEARDLRHDAADAKLEVIDKRLEAIDRRFDAVDARFEAIDKRFDAVHARFEAMQSGIDEQFETQYARIAVLIENTVTKRLNSLFDGLMLTDEKQRKLYSMVESLEERVDTLEIRTG